MPDPLLKWPGGKRKLLPHLLSCMPTEYGRYFEPFFGGGALFFSLQPHNAVLSDLNSDLIECYQVVRDHPEEVIDYLSIQSGSEPFYYKMRSLSPQTPVERAGRLIYLLTLSFNGIYRTNRKGEFNVPYGQRPHLHPKAPSEIREISAALQSATLRTGDFAISVADAQRGDIVYFDPPYTVAHGQNGFLRYNARIFSWQDQHRLAETARELVQRGCHVIVSNADHPSILELYQSFAIKRIERQSTIAANQQHRRLVSECIFHNEP
jgi:DNA adenine methylase